MRVYIYIFVYCIHIYILFFRGNGRLFSVLSVFHTFGPFALVRQIRCCFAHLPTYLPIVTGQQLLLHLYVYISLDFYFHRLQYIGRPEINGRKASKIIDMLLPIHILYRPIQNIRVLISSFTAIIQAYSYIDYRSYIICSLTVYVCYVSSIIIYAQRSFSLFLSPQQHFLDSTAFSSMVSVTRRPGCHRVAGIRHFFKKNIKKADQVKQNKKKSRFYFFCFSFCVANE